jgi:hypothetical protein
MLKTHTRYADDGGVTTGPRPSYCRPGLRRIEDVERRPMTSFLTGLQTMPLDGMGLVDLLDDHARANFRAQCRAHPSDQYPGFEFADLQLATSVFVKSWGCRPFKLDCRPLKQCISDSPWALRCAAGTSNFSKRPERTRATIWCAGVPGVHPTRSCEVVCCARIIVKDIAQPDGPRYYYDTLFVQWHTPVRGALDAPIACMKPACVVPGFSERGLDEVVVAEEWDYVVKDGSLALAGGDVRVPADAYHAHIPADVVALGNVFSFVPLSCIVRRADMVPCFGGEALYGSVPGPLAGTTRPPFFRMYPRA